jgi:hypothetical protein
VHKGLLIVLFKNRFCNRAEADFFGSCCFRQKIEFHNAVLANAKLVSAQQQVDQEH